MSKSSERDKDARAAMRSIIRVTCASQWHQAEGRLDYSMPTGEHIAKLANEVADAMEAERAKRTEAEAPREPLFTVEHLNGAVAAARREGRDAGLREACSEFEEAIRDPELHRNDIPGLRLAIRMAARIAESTPAPAPDVASLQAENAKLRAVAEAAAIVSAAIHRGRAGADADQWGALTAALDAALPGWRTK